MIKRMRISLSNVSQIHLVDHWGDHENGCSLMEFVSGWSLYIFPGVDMGAGFMLENEGEVGMREEP